MSRQRLWVGLACLLASLGLSAMPANSMADGITDERPTQPAASLLDHHAQPFELSSLRGNIVLMFFGYTHCPAICPESLSVMAQALKTLDKQNAQISALFVTVDPGRDTVAQLAGYVPYFSQQLTGLTGTPGQIEAFAKSWHIQYTLHKKSPDDQDYAVDHNANILVLDRQGQLASTVPFGLPASHLVQVVQGLLAEEALPTPAATATHPVSQGLWVGLDGKPYRLEVGKPTLINFWASWCPPCRAELPALNRAWEALQPDGLAMLAVNVGDSKTTVQAFLQDFPIGFPVVLDEAGDSLQSWQIQGMPTTLLLDKEGKTLLRITGEREWDSPSMLRQIRTLLEN